MSRPASSLFASVDFERRCLFRTDDLDEARERTASVFSPHTLTVRGRGQRVRSSMEHIPMGSVSLNRLTWGACIEVDPGRLGSYYLVCLPLEGHACFVLDGRESRVTPRHVAIVNPLQRFHFIASEGFLQVVIRIERVAVEAQWQALIGSDELQAIAFDNLVAMDSDAWRALEPIIGLLTHCASGSCDPIRASVMQARAGDLLVSTLLLHHRHSMSPELMEPGAEATSLHLRRAQAYIHDRLDMPFALADVARGCDVSARRLQALFKDRLGMGPMQWARSQRLRAARQALQEASDGGCTVTDTALRFGFTHLGEFSKAYRQLFGEAPSETLRRRGL